VLGTMFGTVPEDRTLSYPWIGIERIEGKYVALRNVDRLVRTEDFHLGTDFFARLGFSARAIGAYKDQMVFSSGVTSGRRLDEERLLLFGGYAFGRYGNGEEENMQVGGHIRYYHRNFGRHQFHAKLALDAGWNLDGERQILLGGDNGLRGYPRKFQDGDRRVLFTLEQRFYTNREFFRLIHIGAAAFLDAGRAWFAEQPELTRPLLVDVGFGLRFGSSRSAEGSMVHFDIAFPLNGDSRQIQFLINSRESF